MSEPDDDAAPTRADGLCGVTCIVVLTLWIGAMGTGLVWVMNAQFEWYHRRDAYHLGIVVIGIIALAVGGTLGMIWRTSFRPQRREDQDE